MKKLRSLILRLHFCAIAIFVAVSSASAQADSTQTTAVKDTAAAKPSTKIELDKKIYASFDTVPVNLKEGDIISKTLRIRNNRGGSLSFKVDVACPQGWKSLARPMSVYTVANGDSMFIPVQIVPIGKIKGNTKYLISAYVLEKDSTPVAASSFYIMRDKLSNWEISIAPSERIYFLNKDNTSKFNVSILNLGNEDQELLMDIENFRKNISITDTTGKIIRKTTKELKLKPNQDTTFKYGVTYVNGILNQKFIDIESHKPNNIREAQTYSLFIKTSEPKLRANKALQKFRKVDFVKLGDINKSNPFGYSSFPLLFDANLSNMVSGQPILNINLRGTTLLDNGATLNYFSQTIFSTYFYSNQYLMGSSFYVGYYDKKYTVEFGDIGGLGMIGGTSFAAAGRGLSATYAITPQHRVGAFYTRTPHLFETANQQAAGVGYRFTPKWGNVNAGYNRIFNTSQQFTSDYFSTNASLAISSRHSVGFGGVFASHNSTRPTDLFSRQGFMLNGSYNGRYFAQNKLTSTVSFNYISRFFNQFDRGESYFINHYSNYNLNKNWSFQLVNFFNRREYQPIFNGASGFTQSFQSLNNQFNASRKIDNLFVGPGAFYNINTTNNFTFHSRGVNLNFGTYEYENNKIISGSLIAGYTRALNIKPIRDYFFFQFFTLARYKVYSFTARYSYGNIGMFDTIAINTRTYPQLVSLGLNHQYQFQNQHFILQQFFSYSYYNNFQRQVFNYTPELNFYTNDGWRFRLQVGYFISKSGSQGEIRSLNSTISLPESESVISQNVTVNFGVRKEFGIPNPFSKKKYVSTEFIAFVDLNGNGKKDGDEYTLENVVIRLDRWEVLTNEKGEAKILNIPMEKYKIAAFSLIDLEGYYANILEDISIDKDRIGDKKMQIPFVKGIKIYGKIVLDREKISENTELPPDLGGVKISAINGKTLHSLTESDGTFSFYVPYGKYVLNLDEKILGDRFKLLENDIKLDLDKNTESLFVTFFIVEKRRKIKVKTFGPDGKLIGETSTANQDSATANTNRPVNTTVNPNAIPNNGTTINNGGGALTGIMKDRVNSGSGLDLVTQANDAAAKVLPRPNYDVIKDNFLKNKQDATKTKGLIYSIQVGAFQKPLNPQVFDGLTNLMFERIDNNIVRICAGKLSGEGEAMAERDNLAKVGFPNAYVVAYYNGKSISLVEAAQVKKSAAGK